MRKRFLFIVDDEPGNLVIYRDNLELEDFPGQEVKIITACSGQEACDKLEELSEKDIIPDAIIMDYDMPGGMNGLQLLDFIRRHHMLKWSAIFMISGNITVRDKAKGLCYFFDKPVRMEEICQMLKKAWQKD